MGKASTRAHNKYNAKAYDRVNLTLPKGQKEVVQSHASAHGESVNGFIGRAITETMTRDGAGGPQEVAGQPIGGGGVLSPLALQTAQETAQSTGETVSQFIERAVSIQAERDKSSLCLGLNPVTGDRLEGEA